MYSSLQNLCINQLKKSNSFLSVINSEILFNIKVNSSVNSLPSTVSLSILSILFLISDSKSTVKPSKESISSASCSKEFIK